MFRCHPTWVLYTYVKIPCLRKKVCTTIWLPVRESINAYRCWMQTNQTEFIYVKTSNCLQNLLTEGEEQLGHHGIHVARRHHWTCDGFRYCWETEAWWGISICFYVVDAVPHQQLKCMEKIWWPRIIEPNIHKSVGTVWGSPRPVEIAWAAFCTHGWAIELSSSWGIDRSPESSEFLSVLSSPPILSPCLKFFPNGHTGYLL